MTAPAAARRRADLRYVLPVLAGALLAAMTLAVSLGPTDIPVSTVWSVVLHRTLGLGTPGPAFGPEIVVWEIRLPRALLAAIVGAGLGTAGTVVQAVAANPLADPYLLGVSSGASLAAVLVLVFGISGAWGLGLPGAAFAGGCAAFALVWAVARRGGFTPLRLILAGVAVSHLLSGLTSYVVLQAKNEQQTNGVLFWLLGSLGGAEWRVLTVPAIGVAAGLCLLIGRGRRLNALLLGDETAASLGVDVGRLRREMFVVASALTGLVVSVSGAIGFVGLIVPHACRLVVGAEHRRLLPVSALAGGLLLVLVDLVARVALRPEEIPIGVVTALLGAPAFLVMMDRLLERA